MEDIVKSVTKDMFSLIIMVMVVIFVFAIIITIIRLIGGQPYVPEQEKYGQYGERIATDAICSVLHEDDYLFTNVFVSYEGKETELDNVIVNKYGVFIIEVKNYKGKLYGDEDDYKWKKYKDDDYGNVFEKEVKNPIRQVKRQEYILAGYLKSYGINVWVDGYALFVKNNSPVESEYVLASLSDIDSAIHSFRKKILSKKTLRR